jgi:hypothetical protein
MASNLLPLWQAARALYSDPGSAIEEREAIANQIREAMTSEQLSAIDALDLAAEDFQTVMREMIAEILPEGMRPGDGSEGSPFSGEGRPLGSQPGPGFGGGPGSGESLSPEMQATMEAERGGRPGTGINVRFFDVLIELLQERMAAV